jgi:hypothetical protein
MKSYGHINLLQNQLQNAALPLDTQFPLQPVVGQLVFIDKIVYICVEIAINLPVWVPLTREIEMYMHNQPVASSLWTINHNMHTTFIIPQVYDANNIGVLPDEVTIINPNSLTISFGIPIAGRAVILSGSVEGNEKPVYAYEYSQVSPSDAWVIAHNLGYNPMVRVFIGNQEVQPLSIVHDSINQVTISFSTPQTGIAKLV